MKRTEKSIQSNRREFLQTTTAGAASLAALGLGVHVGPVSANVSRSSLEKLNIAFVGVGNKGFHNVNQLTHENVSVLCDVDEKYLSAAAAKFPRARKYRDYRKMLEAEANRIDAVVVSTADHTHAPATSVALDLGKHVYCEKPLTHTVAESRAIAKLTAKNKLVTQMGIQIHANGNYRRVVEMIQGGAIGAVKEVYCWCNKGWSDGRFKPWDKPVPANLDWDLWLGPAAERAYSPSVHPGNWRRFWEYGSGTFGDMACHVMDLPFWALDLQYPKSIECEGPELHPDGAPSWVGARYEFAATKNHGDLKFHWSDGNKHFEKVKQTLDQNGQPLSRWGLGTLFVGENGMLAADYGRRQLLPESKFENFVAPEKTIANSIGHWKEWTEACKSGDATTCNFDYASRLTETVLLGIVAFRAGEKVHWNENEGAVLDASNAEQFVSKKYRKGFEVVGL